MFDAVEPHGFPETLVNALPRRGFSE